MRRGVPLVLVVLALVVLPFAARAQSACGYSITQRTDVITPGVTDVGNHCDDCTTTIMLPFPVVFYGVTYNSVVLSSNGNVQFVGNTSSLSASCLPSSDLESAIAAYQDDLRTDGGGEGIFTTTTGSPGSRQFIIEWRVHYFGHGGTANFEVIFTENSPRITTIYGATEDNGAGETVGVQNAGTGTQFTEFSCQAASLTEGLRLDFDPNCSAGAPAMSPRALSLMAVALLACGMGLSRRRLKRS